MTDLPCFTCKQPESADAREEIMRIFLAVAHGEPLPPPPDIAGDLPAKCCRRKPKLVPPVRGQREATR